MTIKAKRPLLKIFGTLCAVLLLVTLVGFKAADRKVEAAPSSYLNFQGRILTSSGNLVPDGYYNIQFKIYNVSSAGAALWTESYYDSNGVTAGNDNRVRVVNGYFSVNLGSQTAFSGVSWDQQNWLTMNIGGSTQTATPTYDGEMNPRIQLTAVPLALVANNVNSGDTSTASTNSNNVTIKSGNATGTTSNSGNISIDVGTATSTAGTISVGTANTTAITVGRTGVTTTLQGVVSVTGSGTALSVTNNATIGGTLQITGLTTATGGVNVAAAAGYYYGGTSSPLSVELTRAIPTTLNDYIDIGSLNVANGAHNIRISVTVPANSFSTAKTYLLPIFYNATQNVWYTAVPAGDTGAYGANTFEVDVNVNGGNAYFRLRRTGGSTVGTAYVRLESTGYTSDAFTASSTTGSTTTPSLLYGRIYQNMLGNVGIGNISPTSLFSVGSTSQFQINSSGAIAAVTGITTSGGYTQSGTTANTFTGATTFSAAGTALSVTNNATVSGTLTLGTLGTTDTSTFLCRNSSNIIAGCSTTGTGAAFVQGGNSFGAGAILGTNDNYSLSFETNNVTRLTFDTSNNANLTGILNLTAAGGSQAIKVIGTGTTGVASSGYMGFYDSNSSTRYGYFGDASVSDQDIYLIADTGSKLKLGANGSNNITIDTTGKVGIGTSGTPASTLSVGGTTGNFQVDSAGAIAASTGIANSGGYTQSGTTANTFTGATTFSAAGTALTVTNNATISGNLTVTGTAYLAGGAQTYYANTYTVPTATNVNINLTSATSTLVAGMQYRIVLSTTGTGTSTGAVYIVYQSAVGTWTARMVSAADSISNHPLLGVSGTNVYVYHNHALTYSIKAQVYGFDSGNATNTNATYFGLEGAVTNLGGNIGIGTVSPAAKLEISGVVRSDVNSGQGAYEVRDTGTMVAALYDGSGVSNIGILDLYNGGVLSTRIRADGTGSYIGNGNFGVGDTTPAALFTVGSGDLFQVNSSGAIAAVTGITTSGGYTQSGSGTNTFSGATTISATGTALTLSGAATTAINISNTGVTTDINLQNGETIDNDTDGTIRLSATNAKIYGGNLLLDGYGSNNGGIYLQNTQFPYNVSRNNSNVSVTGALSGRIANQNTDMQNGTTGYTVYDNLASGAVSIANVADSQAPNTSGKILRVSYSALGSPSPGYGGFYVGMARCSGTNNAVNSYCYREGNRYLVKIWAKIPTTRSIVHNANLYGTGASFNWRTPTAGTGDWMLYEGIMNVGIGGTFSTVGFFYISGGANSAFDWDVARVEYVGIDETPSVEQTSSLNIGYAQGISLGYGGLAVLNNATVGGTLAVTGAVTGGTYNGQTISSAANFTGTLAVTTLGTANTATYLCRNASNQIAACNTTGTGAAFLQGGNSFGAIATIGTNDAYSVQVETAGVTRLTIDTSGNATLTGTLAVQGTTASIGVSDTTGGFINLYGNTTGSAEGGELRLYTAADHDTVIDTFVIDAYQDDLRIHDGTNVRLTVAGDTGYVGIGATAPVSLLEVKAGNGITGALTVTGGNTNVLAVGEINSRIDFRQNDSSMSSTNQIAGSIASVTEYDNGAYAGLAFYTGKQGRATVLQEAVRINYDGNLGVGTTAPTRRLQVGDAADTASNVIRIANSSGSDALPILSLFRSGNIETVLAQNGTNFQFAVNPAGYLSADITAAAKFTVTSGGNFGIGDTTPASLFTVGATDAFQVDNNGMLLLGNSGDAFGNAYIGFNNGGSINTATAAYGITGEAFNTGSAGVTGVNMTAGTNYAGTVAYLKGANFTTRTLNAGGTVTNAYTVYANNPAITAGAITNNYGLYVADQTSATNDYGIAIEGADTQALWIGSGANNTDAANGIAFGSSRDTNLYRSAADILRSDDSLYIGGQASIANGTAMPPVSTVTLKVANNAGGVALRVGADTDSTSATAGLDFGASGDTNLYRSAANTLRTDDSFSVGGTLAVTSSATVGGAVTIGTYGVERTFGTTFTNAVADQKFDLYFSRFWGEMEVTLTSSYSNQNAAGSISKKFYLGLSPAGSIFQNSSRYTESSGLTPTNFAISDVTWDAANSRYRVQIVHRTSTGNVVSVRVKALAASSTDATEISTNMAMSSIYTTDTTAFSTPIVSFTDSVGIGVASAASRLHVYENNSNTGNAAGLTVEQAGTGDAVVQYLLTGAQRWVTGIDNSDGDKFKIGRGADWATGTDLSIDTSGNIAVGTGSGTFALNSSNIDISSVGVITGATGITSTGVINLSGATSVSIVSTADDATYTGFVTNDSGTLKYRTAAQVVSDLGAVTKTNAAQGGTTTLGNWYRIATSSGGGQGRGAAKIVLTNGGGTGTPNQIVFNVVKDWAANGSITLISQNGTSCWGAIRMVNDSVTPTVTYIDAQAATGCQSSDVTVTSEGSTMNYFTATAFTTPAGGSEVTLTTLDITSNTLSGVSSVVSGDNFYRLTATGLNLAGGYTQSGTTANTFTGATTFSAAGTALSVTNNATISGTLTSGAINGQTISSAANFTGTVVVASTLTANGDILLGAGDQIDFTDEVGDKAYWYGNTYGTGIESSTLTNWSASQFRWRTGGTDVTGGTEQMLLSATGLDVAGTFSAGTANAFTVSAAGVVAGGTYNGQTISSAASFTGTVAVAGNVNFNGATTLGDTSGDSVTSNAATWTFANDTNVTLTGGVNGLSFDTSTLSIDSTNDRVGIGTIAPDTALDVNGAISRSQNGIRTYKNVHSYNISLATQTGTIVITGPKGFTNTMLRITIKGYDYSGNGAWEAIVSGYAYGVGPSWINTSSEIRGQSPFSSIRLGSDGTNIVIMLGTTSTVWQYPKVVVEEVVAGHAGMDGWGAAWSTALVTDEATPIAYSSIVTPTQKGPFIQGGNSFGTTATLGTNDSFSLVLETANVARLTVTNAGAATFSGTLTSTGLLTANAGLTVSGGATTISGGTISLNTTGTSNTAIGNATGTFALNSSALDISTAGALTGVTGITTSGGYTQSGTTANTFTGATTFSAAGTALSVTNNATVSGTLTLGTLGTTDTSTFLCRNSSNIIAGCSTTGTGAAFVQGGNSFGATATLGTNDAQSLVFETNGSSRLNISSTGTATFTGGRSVTVDSTNGQVNIRAGAGGWAIGSSATSSVDAILGTYGFYGTADVLSYYYIGSTYTTPYVTVLNSNGYTNIGGDTSPDNLFSVGSTSQFQVNSSGAIAAVTGITTSGGYTQSGTTANTFTGASTFSAAGTGLAVTNNATIGGTLAVGPNAASDNLTINGGLGVDLTFGIRAQTAGGASTRSIFTQNATTGALSLAVDPGGNGSSRNFNLSVGTASNAIFANGSGSVGIGTATPATRLSIVGGDFLTNNNALGDANSGLRLVSKIATTHYNWKIGAQDSVGGLDFTPSTAVGGTSFTTPAMVILNSGNVGIGDTTPASLFTVGSGDLFQVNSSGAIAASAGITTLGTVNLNVSGSAATNINTGGTGNVAIGNGTGTFSLNSSALDVSTAGAITGATGISSTGLVRTTGALVVGANSADGDFVQFNDTFDGVSVNTTNWTVTGAATQNGNIAVTGNNLWTDRGITSVQSYRRSQSLTLTADFTPTSSASPTFTGMVGFSSSTTMTYTNMPHAIYFVSGAIQVYENNVSRGGVGSYTTGTTYRIKITVNPTGAVYFISSDGGNTWLKLYDGTANNVTTSPLYVRMVINNAAATGTLDNVTVSNGLDVYSSSEFVSKNLTIGNGNLLITSGNIGIGDSTPAAALTVGSGDLFQVNSSGNLTWVNAATVTLNNSANALNFDANTLTIDALNNRVGVGTTAPLRVFDVAGGIRAVGSTEVAASARGIDLIPALFNTTHTIRGYNNSGGGLAIDTQSTGTGFTAASINLVNNSSSSYITMSTSDATANATERLRISSAGNVGIGGDTTPDSMFNVGSTSQFQVNSSGAIAAVTGITTSGGYTQSGTTANTFTGASTFSAAGTALSVTNNAGVGGALSVGTIAGTVHSLSIKSSGTNTVNLSIENNSTSNKIVQFGQSLLGHGFGQLLTNGGVIAAQLHSGGDSYFNGGNVGIGDTSPAALFTVGSGDLFQVNSSGAIAAVTGITSSGAYTQSGTGANTFTGASTFSASGTALTVSNNATFGDASSDIITFNGNIVANATATGTTATTSGTGTNTTTVTFTGTTSFANNDIIFIDNAGQDYYTRIVSGANAASVTVSPAVTFENARTVTKYTAQNIGATASDYTTLSNRFFQGYFLGGVVTGAGSTTYSDSQITSTSTSGLRVTSSGANFAALQVDSTSGIGANILNLQNNGSTVFNVSSTGVITASDSLTFNGTTARTITGPSTGGLTMTVASGPLTLSTTTSGTLAVNSAGALNLTGAAASTWTLGSNALTITSSNFNLNSAGDLTISGDLGPFSDGAVTAIADTGSLVPNAGFEVNNDGTSTVADGWTYTAIAGSQTPVVVGAASAAQGNSAQGLDTAANTTSGKFESNCIPITGGVSYSTYVRAASGVVSVHQLAVSIDRYTSRGNCTAKTSASNVGAGANTNVGTGWSDIGGTWSGTSGTHTWARVVLTASTISATSTRLRMDSVRLIQSVVSSGIDLAENFATEPGSNLKPGELVSMGAETEDGAYVVRADNGNKGTLSGVVTTKPGLLLDDGKEYEKVGVALTGRVPVKVNGENGPIAVGDYITTSSTAGIGAKAVATGRVVGQAMTSFDGNGEGTVTVLINPIIYTAPVQGTLQADGLHITGVSNFDGDVTMTANLTVTGSTTLGTVTVTGNLNLQKNLTVAGNVTVQKNLTVVGETTVAKITINGKIITGGDAPTIALGEKAKGKDAAVTITGNDTAGNVLFNAGVVEAPTNTIEAGQQVSVTFHEAFTAAPRVAITPKDAGSATVRYYVETTTTGFTVHFLDSPAAGTNYTFDYIVIQ